MRLRKYVVQTLNEKVSRDEIEEALNNPNVTIGIELEFIVDALGGYIDQDAVDDYEYAHSDWVEFNDDYRRYERDRDRISDRVQQIMEKVDNLETEYSDLDETIGDDEDENQSITKEMDKLQDRIDDLKERIEELTTERDELEYPYPSNVYITYMKDRDALGKYWEDSIYEGDIPEPIDPREDGDMAARSEDSWRDAVNDMTDLWDTLPVPEYEIEATNYDTWSIKYDSSVENGVELVSPLLSMQEFLEITPKLFDWITTHGGTDTNTGLHVHMGLKGVSDLETELDPIKMILLVDEDYIWKFFDERKVNIYTTSMKPKLAGRGINVDEIKTLIDTKKLKKDMNETHFDAINFQSWKEGHVEFRHMGGTDYHRKWKEVRLVVARNVHALSAGVDPDYKRQEYLTKLARMTNRFDDIKWQMVLNRLDTIMRPFAPSILEKYLKMEYVKIKSNIGRVNFSEIMTSISNGMKNDFSRFATTYIDSLLIDFNKKFPDYEGNSYEMDIITKVK